MRPTHLRYFERNEDMKIFDKGLSIFLLVCLSCLDLLKFFKISLSYLFIFAKQDSVLLWIDCRKKYLRYEIN